jgi:hypothetical protein
MTILSLLPFAIPGKNGAGRMFTISVSEKVHQNFEDEKKSSEFVEIRRTARSAVRGGEEPSGSAMVEKVHQDHQGR